ncbi:MAG: nucleotidyltransferase domain-containing protein [Snowella sp.]|jgi:predicted nucleotidyltransferase|nr:nucleotidyltransferase domain-containing protein [Snowella sp.]
MIEQSKILNLVQKIIEDFQPQKIILFGSYAYGQPRDDSDIDLLVILPFTEKKSQKSLEILNKIKPIFALDLLVRTPSEIQQRLEWGDFLLQEIFEKGKILYESPND